jgi:hypothetical protein
MAKEKNGVSESFHRTIQNGMTREKKPRVIVFSFQRELTGILHLYDKAKIRISQGGILDKEFFYGSMIIFPSCVIPHSWKGRGVGKKTITLSSIFHSYSC